jgi:hypothetical protein
MASAASPLLGAYEYESSNSSGDSSGVESADDKAKRRDQADLAL